MQAIQRFWAKSVLNKITLLMSFSLVFCCCGWTGRIGSEQPTQTGFSESPRLELVANPAYRPAGR